MKQLFDAGTTLLSQLAEAISLVSEEDFRKPSTVLGQATIGQHLRHTLEFFVCLEQGYACGIVNYDNRQHDKTIESNRDVALNVITRVLDFIRNHPADKQMLLEVGYLHNSDDCVPVETNFMRELAYNIEHTVHHMAIIKIGIREVAPYVPVPHSFGVAVSTLRYREEVMISS